MLNRKSSHFLSRYEGLSPKEPFSVTQFQFVQTFHQITYFSSAGWFVSRLSYCLYFSIPVWDITQMCIRSLEHIRESVCTGGYLLTSIFASCQNLSWTWNIRCNPERSRQQICLEKKQNNYCHKKETNSGKSFGFPQQQLDIANTRTLMERKWEMKDIWAERNSIYTRNLKSDIIWDVVWT